MNPFKSVFVAVYWLLWWYWLWVIINAQSFPSPVFGVQPVAGRIDPYLSFLHFLIFLTRRTKLFLLWAAFPGAVSPVAKLLFINILVAETADPQLFSGVDVIDNGTLLGAWIADQEAAIPAVVSTIGPTKLCREAPHAFASSRIRNPGNSKLLGRFAAGALH